jgi:hypothetical protein
MSADPAAARRMVNTVPEEEEAAEQRRYHRYHEMLWEHIEGANERFKGDMDDDRASGAFQESNLLVHLGKCYFGGLMDALRDHPRPLLPL